MSANASLMRRYLALDLPLLPSERLARARAAPPDTAPFALVEKRRGAVRLVALDADALRLGLTPGLTLADARARVPDLAVFDHDPMADSALLERLADGCERYTPMVALDAPAGLILDITGCAHLFGGETALANDLVTRLSRIGVTARAALGMTPQSARARSRFGVMSVADLPVEALELDDDTHVTLRRAGLKHIGDLAERQRAPVAARFGESCALRLAALLEEVDHRITPRRVPPVIHSDVRFAEPIGRIDDVMRVLADLARATASELAGRGQGGRRFTATLFRCDGHVARLAVETGRPTRDADVVERLFRERIEALADPLDPGFGYDAVRLGVSEVELLAPEQLAFGGNDAGTAVQALLDRLSVRFGRDRVRRFHGNDTHIPECAAYELPALDGESLGHWPRPDPGEPPARPLLLLDPPQPIETIAEIPDGPPRQFRWRRASHIVVRYEGPERIAAEWWRRRKGHMPGGAGLTRDYYRLEDSDGRRFWVFRHGLYGREKPDPRWYLHGLFA